MANFTRYFRRGDSTNAVVAVFLLVLLMVFAGPNMLPRLLANSFPFVDEGAPCDWLWSGTGRAEHQSLIGRAVTNPLALTVESSPVPTSADGTLTIRITVINQSIGTIPIVFNPNQILVGDNGTSGLGLIFDPPNTLSTGAVRQDAASVPESNIRLLGPRQRCIQKVDFPVSRLDPTVATGNAKVRAYYRNTTPGQSIPVAGSTTAPIFPDEGLWVGFVVSDPYTILVASQ